MYHVDPMGGFNGLTTTHLRMHTCMKIHKCTVFWRTTYLKWCLSVLFMGRALVISNVKVFCHLFTSSLKLEFVNLKKDTLFFPCYNEYSLNQKIHFYHSLPCLNCFSFYKMGIVVIYLIKACDSMR